MITDNTQKTLVLAGNHAQAFEYCLSHGINPHRHIINNENQLFGRGRGTKIILVGTYRKRKDWNDIKNRALERGCIFIEENNVKEYVVKVKENGSQEWYLI